MFIEEIYKSLSEGKSVLLVGPRGCGKSTVMAGVLAKVGKEHMYGNIDTIMNAAHWPEKISGKIVCTDMAVSEEICFLIKKRMADVGKPQFVFLTSNPHAGMYLHEAEHIDVIGWPASECPP